jgi:hypothetical protein
MLRVGTRIRYARLNLPHRFDHPIDIGLVVIGVGADSQAAGAATEDHVALETLPADRVRVAAGKLEGDDTAFMLRGAVAEYYRPD